MGNQIFESNYEFECLRRKKNIWKKKIRKEKKYYCQQIADENNNKTRDSLNLAKLANNEENLNKTSGGGAIRRVFRRS